jgi:hypothetical protein
MTAPGLRFRGMRASAGYTGLFAFGFTCECTNPRFLKMHESTDSSSLRRRIK